ncbi:MAG: putative toxin-antitoxin system toxin component, PIN family [Thermodesulfobacteriota bacterium]|nr:putative toxin-antitoxin system toxin component, PIN family [Thermodesulfobacteriota bacterium]
MKPFIVIDTCVLISALRSRNGASFRLLSLIDSRKFSFSLSVPLVLECEATAKRISRSLGLTHADIEDIIDYFCTVGEHRKVHYLWRPNLKDPSDDFVLELAVESECQYIVTYNIKDFSKAGKFNVTVITPLELLRKIGEIV